MACNTSKTHTLSIRRKGQNVTREWIRLSDGQIETNAARLAALEATLDADNCDASVRHVEAGCIASADGTQESVFIHMNYLQDSALTEPVQEILYTDAMGVVRTLEAGDQLTVGKCAPDGTMVTETGCLADPASVDLSGADKCHITEVIINGDSIFIELDEGWTVTELVTAINDAKPDTVRVENGSVVSANGRTLGNLQLVCEVVSFEETFGTGGNVGNRQQVESTTYTFVNTGPILDGEYGVTSFSDTQLADYNTGAGRITADSKGNPNGNAMIINAAEEPGIVYTQSTPAEVGHEYRLKFSVINTVVNAAIITPNIKYEIINLDDNSVVETGDSGDVPKDWEWHDYGFDFTAKTPNLGFRLTNNAPDGNGNDLAIDSITFAEVVRSDFVFEQRGDQIPVEIIKKVDSEGGVESIRVFSADGTTEYTIPDPDGRILSTGQCMSSSSKAAVTQAPESIERMSSGTGTGNGSIDAGYRRVIISSRAGDVFVGGNYLVNPAHGPLVIEATNNAAFNGQLPTISLTGGTWQWIGLEE